MKVLFLLLLKLRELPWCPFHGAGLINVTSDALSWVDTSPCTSRHGTCGALCYKQQMVLPSQESGQHASECHTRVHPLWIFKSTQFIKDLLQSILIYAPLHQECWRTFMDTEIHSLVAGSPRTIPNEQFKWSYLLRFKGMDANSTMPKTGLRVAWAHLIYLHGHNLCYFRHHVIQSFSRAWGFHEKSGRLKRTSVNLAVLWVFC